MLPISLFCTSYKSFTKFFGQTFFPNYKNNTFQTDISVKLTLALCLTLMQGIYLELKMSSAGPFRMVSSSMRFTVHNYYIKTEELLHESSKLRKQTETLLSAVSANKNTCQQKLHKHTLHTKTQRNAFILAHSPCFLDNCLLKMRGFTFHVLTHPYHGEE